jgi:hypothetical protein
LGFCLIASELGFYPKNMKPARHQDGLALKALFCDGRHIALEISAVGLQHEI